MYESFFGLEARPFLASPLAERYYPAGSIEHARETVARCVERQLDGALVAVDQVRLGPVADQDDAGDVGSPDVVELDLQGAAEGDRLALHGDLGLRDAPVEVRRLPDLEARVTALVGGVARDRPVRAVGGRDPPAASLS